MVLETSIWTLSTVGGTVVGLIGAGLLDRFRDDEPSDDDGGDPLADDGGSAGGGLEDELGGSGGFGGDGQAGGMQGESDALGGLEADADDGGVGGSLDGSDGGARELERRVEEIEEDLDSLSSTVSTVRSENDGIDETVTEIQEDIRNLLGIYEMVTQGVNPFVDEGDALGGGGFDGGGTDAALGLFDRDAGGDSGEDDGAFDDPDSDPATGSDPTADSNRPGSEPELDATDGSVDPILEETIDDADGPDREDASRPDGSSSGGRDFSDLKEEFDAEDRSAPASSGDPVRMSTGSVSASKAEDAPERGEDASHERSGGEPGKRGENAEHAPGYGHDRGEPEGFEDGFEYVDADELQPGRREPYLRSLPADHVCDLLVMEWLEYLVETADVTDAARAIRYYERIDWISPSVAEQLRAFLSGFGQVDRNEVIRPGTAILERDHHTRSLQYVLRLADTDSRDVLLDRWEDLTGRQLLAPGDGRASNGEEGGNGAGRRSGTELGTRDEGDRHAEGGRHAQSRPRSGGQPSEGGRNDGGRRNAGDRPARGRSDRGGPDRGRSEHRNSDRSRSEHRGPNRSEDGSSRGAENRHDGRTGRSDTRSLSPRSGGRGTDAEESTGETRDEKRTDGVTDRETGRPFSRGFPNGR